MAKIKTLGTAADDVVLTAARNLANIVMTEAKLHIEKEGYASIEGLDEESAKRLTVLGRALLEFAKELTDEKSPINKLLVDVTMEEVISKATEVPDGIDEDDVDEEYVADPNHIDPMFG